MLIVRIENAGIERQALEDSLRAAIIRTAYADAKLSPLPDGSTFTLTIELREDTDRPGGIVLPRHSLRWHALTSVLVEVDGVGVYVALDSGREAAWACRNDIVFGGEFSADSGY